MRLAMVKYKIKFVKIWLNFKESQDASYMLMKPGLENFNVVQYFVAFLWSCCPGQFFTSTIWIFWTWHYVTARAGLELNKKFKLQVNGMLQSITLDNLNHISFTIQSVFMSLSSGQLLLFHADFIHHAKNLVFNFPSILDDVKLFTVTISKFSVCHCDYLNELIVMPVALLICLRIRFPLSMCRWKKRCW